MCNSLIRVCVSMAFDEHNYLTLLKGLKASESRRSMSIRHIEIKDTFDEFEPVVHGNSIKEAAIVLFRAYLNFQEYDVFINT